MNETMCLMNENYMSRKRSLMREFEKSMGRVRQTLVARYGEEPAEEVIRESGEEYERIIPEIPYIGKRSPMLIFLLPTSRYLPVYRTMLNHGYSTEEAEQVVYEMGVAAIEAVPGIVRWVIGQLWFSSWFMARLRKRAAESVAGKYPGGYVFHFIEGDGQNFDYGIDYIECASCKFLEAQNALELAPMACAVDKVASEMLGWGLSRTMTLAEGHERCDFRFKKGGRTQVPIPRSLAQE